MKILLLTWSLLAVNLAWALDSDGLSSALIAEFYLQNEDAEEAYLSYQEILETAPTESLAERALEVANSTNNKEWQQDSLYQLLKFRENDLKLNARYLLTLINQTQFDLAKIQVDKLFAVILQSVGDSYEAHISLARILSTADNKPLSARLMAKYGDADSVGARNSLALYYQLTNQYDLAIDQLQKSFRINPHLDKTIIIFANVLHAKGRTKDAILFLREKSNFAKSISIDIALATYLIKDKQYKLSVDVYLRLIENDNADANKWRRALSAVYLALGQVDLAEKELNELIKDKKYQDYAHYSLGLINEQNNRYDEAKKHFELINEGRYFINAIRRLVALTIPDDKNAAIAIIERVDISRIEDYLALLSVKAGVFEYHEEWEQAYEVYSLIIEIEPNPSRYYARALIADRMGRIDLVEEDLRVVIETDEEDHEALNALGYSLAVHTKRYVEAKQYIEKALKLKPKAFYILDSMGWVLHKLGKHQEAIDFLQQAMAIKPDAEIAAHLAVVFDAIGQKDKSNAYLLEAIALDKNNPAVVEIFDTLKKSKRVNTNESDQSHKTKNKSEMTKVKP